MNDNLPQKYNDSIFYKIKRFCFNIFNRKKEGLVVKNLEISKTREEFKNYLTQAEVQEQAHEKEIKNSILDIVKEKPELLKTMSIEKLKKVILLYEEAIKETELKIQNLKKNA